MTLDWSRIDQKKRRLNKAPYTPEEKAEMEQIAASILQLSPEHLQRSWGETLGYGMRSLALIRPRPEIPHRFADHGDILLKLFRGKAEDFLVYHSQDYPILSQAGAFRHLQRSYDAGRLQHPSLPSTSWALLEYKQGRLLQDVLLEETSLPGQVEAWSHSIMIDIWLPLWDAGLRFKDCHPGNFLLQEGGGVVMIDTEQMRKSAREMLSQDDAPWTQRDKHEAQALRRLPGLLWSLWEASRGEARMSKATFTKKLRAQAAYHSLERSLHHPGRKSRNTTDTRSPEAQTAQQAYEHLVETCLKGGLR